MIHHPEPTPIGSLDQKVIGNEKKMKVFTAISEYRTFYLLPLCHESASLSALKANNITMS